MGPWRARWAILPNPHNAGQQVIGNQEEDHAAGVENGQQVPRNQDPITWIKLLTVLITGSLVLGLVIIGVELEIRWNKLANLNTIPSTGQILPLVVGTMTLARALVLLLIDIFGSVISRGYTFLGSNHILLPLWQKIRFPFKIKQEVASSGARKYIYFEHASA